MKKLLALSLVLLLLATMAPAPAATKEGDQEVSVGLSVRKNDETTVTTLQFGIGYFVTEAIELRGTAIISRIDSGDTDATAMFFGLDGLFHFNTTGDTVPYVGAGISGTRYEAGDTSEGGVAAKGILGLKHFLDDNTTLNVEYNFIKTFSQELEDVDQDIEHVLLISLSYFF